MPKATKYRLFICFTTFCLFLFLLTPDIILAADQLIKNALPQTETQIQSLINKLKDPDRYIRRKAVRALGDIGPDAKAAVPALIEALNDKDRDVRSYAANSLGQIGPEAKSAVPALIEALKDKDRDVHLFAAGALERIGPKAVPALIEALKDENVIVRQVAARFLRENGPDAKAAVSGLIEALKDQDKYVRYYAAQALGNIGPDAKAAVPALIKALKDEYDLVRENAALSLALIGPEAKAAVQALIEALKDRAKAVRAYAAAALGDIGPDAKAAVPPLIEVLKDKDGGIHSFAAEALGKIGLEAKTAVPPLIEALKDKDRDVRRYAAEAIGKIATALREDKATNMIKDLEAAKKALSAYPKFKEQENKVRWAFEYLEKIKPPLWEIVWNLFKENILKSFLILAYLLWIIIWLSLFWLRPLTLLQINRAFKPFDFKLPSWLGSITLPLRFFLFVGFLNHRPRVLDAWVKKYLAAARDRFSEKPTVYDRKIHISVPVELDRQTIPDLTTKQLQPTFARQIGCLLIWGEGGSGKTSLACQIAKWAMAEDKEIRLCDHLMLPVLIEQELSSQENQSAFFNAVGRQLQDVTDQANPIPEELLERLLRHRRVLVIVDHLSEMSESTRTQINPAERDFPANAFIVTSRLEESLGGVTKTLIKPLRIRRDRLSPFMEAYLTHRGKSDLFTDSEFHDACRRITEMVPETIW